MTVSYQCLPFKVLTGQQVYDMLRLRSEVFVVEQACIYQDLDNKDVHPQVHHLLMQRGEHLIGYARILPKNLSYSTPSMGRILIAPSARASGLGRSLLKQCILKTQSLWPQQPITIGAQVYLLDFYQSFGFMPVSEHYLEDGIPHVDMVLKP